jgi:hypothetical protein
VSRIVVGIVVPLEVNQKTYVYIGDIEGRKLVVEKSEWEEKRPTKSRMKCYFWNGMNGRRAWIMPAPDLVPE